MRKIFLCLALLLATLTHAFEASKYYIINKNGNTSAYMYASGTQIGVGALSGGNANYIWQLIPTETEDGYYLKNVGTGQYAQTCNLTGNATPVDMGDTPLEYIVSTGAGTTGAQPTYFMASNDQDGIDYSQDATRGLNYNADLSKAVAFYIKTGRGNSYWTITETTYNPVSEPSSYSGIGITFNRTGTDASSVTCSVVDSEGSAISGATATVTCSHDFKATANAVTDAILCPNVNGNTNPTITLSITIAGLESAFQFNRAALDIHALNGGSNYQESADGIVRQWNVSMAENTVAFGSLSDIDIAAGVAEHHKEWEITGSTVTVGDDGTLSLVLTITKGTANSGCFFGLSSVRLSHETAEEQDPVISHTFSSDKYYYVTWFGNNASYMTEVIGGKLQVAGKSDVQKQIWQLVPTEKNECYYIQNAISGKYIQSCNQTNSNKSLVVVGKDPVEYYITKGSDGTASAYRLTSTDCPDFQDTATSPHGLNKDGASTNVIVWMAGAGNTGSYWYIVETDFDRTAYDAAQEELKKDPLPSLAVITLPCTTLGADTYLSQIDIEGVGVQLPLHYTSGQPAAAYNLYTKQRATLVRGREATLQATLVGKDVAGLEVTVYADFDGDGVFEQTMAAEIGDVISAVLKVPAETTNLQGRIRIVVDQSGSNNPDEAYGTVYDLPVNVLSVGDTNGDQRVSISDATTLIKVLGEGAAAEARYNINGDDTIDKADVDALIELLKE